MLRIKLRYDDVDMLAARFAPNVGKSGLFLPTKSLQAVGAEVKFELRLVDDKVVITGLGKVKAAKAPDPDHPRAAFGMAIELTRVTRESRDVILRILAKRKELGLREVAIPLPEDIDAAKSQLESGVREGVRDVTPLPEVNPTTIDSAPIPAPLRDSEPILQPPPLSSGSGPLASGMRDTGPLRDNAPVVAESGPVLTAPRRASGPIAIAKVHTVAALAPEAPRKKRPAVTEIIERVSGPIAAVTVPGLDDDVDVGAVMAMARALAGTDLDAELEALRDSAAAPIEISIEAASAELARQLGGVAVRRDRSGGWAPPPSVVPVERKADVAAPIATETAPDDGTAGASNDRSSSNDESREASTSLDASDSADDSSRAGSRSGAPSDDSTRAGSVDDLGIDNDVAQAESAENLPTSTEHLSTSVEEQLAAPEPASTFVEGDDPQFSLSDMDDVPGEDHEVDPEQIADEIHQLGEDDFEEVEHTMIGGEPEPPAPVVYTEPSVAAAIEASLDQQLADADAEPDDLGFDRNDRGRATFPADPPPTMSGYSAPSTYTKPSIEQPEYALPAYDPSLDPVAPPPTELLGDDDELEEIDDFEILAEADEGDEDLLGAHGEAEASSYQEGAYQESAYQEGAYPEQPGDYANEFEQGEYAQGQGEYARGQGEYAQGEYAQAQGEYATGAAHPPYAQEPPRGYAAQPEPATRPSYDYSRHSDPDFAARLELSSEHTPAPGYDSAGRALAALDDDEPQNAYEPMAEFTLGGDIPADEFDSPHADFHKPSAYARAEPLPDGFPPLSKFDESDVHAPAPEPRFLHNTTPPPRKGEDGYDLETALEALDVDLDDLAIPHAKTERGPTIPPTNRPRTPSQRFATQRPRTPTGSRVPKRPTTDDGVLIDFDDDDD